MVRYRYTALSWGLRCRSVVVLSLCLTCIVAERSEYDPPPPQQCKSNALLQRSAAARSGRRGHVAAEDDVQPDASQQQTRSIHQCAASFGSFTAGSAQPLTSSALVTAPRQTDDFESMSNLERGHIFVHPPSRLAFCGIAKNACSSWVKVLGKLATNDLSWDLVDYELAYKMTEKYGRGALADVFNDPNATRVVIVRDPLTRFVSSFLDKCFSDNCMNYHCFARGLEEVPKYSGHLVGRLAGMPISFHDAVTWMLGKDPAKEDSHWKLQSEYCELHKRVQEYTVIGLMKKDTLSRDAKCIMDIGGISEFDSLGGSERSKPFWRTTDRSNEAAFGNHTNLADEAAEEDVLKKLFTPEAARALIAHLGQDYETFNFDREPAWIAEATGEWYDYVSDTCERPTDANAASLLQKSQRSAAQQEEEDVDDIVLLAARAGYKH